jgi:flagellin-like protein
MNVTKGLSYVVGVLVVLAVTLAAVVAFSQILGFQAGVLTILQALDVRRLGESLVPVEGISIDGKIILYNNAVSHTHTVHQNDPGTVKLVSPPLLQP